MIEGVLFDMDGLLVDTEPIYHNANTEAIASMGYEPDDAYLRQCMGLSVQAWGEALYAHYGKDFPLDEMRRRMDKIRTRVFEEDGIQSMKGAKELLDYLDEKGIPKAVASSTPKEKAQYILGRAGLGGRFEVEVYGDMVKRSKPNPDIFLLAASLLGKEPCTSPAPCLIPTSSFWPLPCWARSRRSAWVWKIPRMVSGPAGRRISLPCGCRIWLR